MMHEQRDASAGAVVRADFAALNLVERAAVLAAFGSAYLLSVLIGLGLRENSERLTVMWPAAGLLFMALWIVRPRSWIWFVAVQVSVDLAVGMASSEHFSFSGDAPFALANTVDAVVGASVAARLITDARIPRVRNVLCFFAAVAIGAAASAVFGAFAVTRGFGGANYLREWQLWWAGNWLGSLCVAPVMMGWAVRWRARRYSAPAAPALEMMVVGALMLAMTIWVFSAPPGGIVTILDMPFILLSLIVVAAFRFPPRWSSVLAAVAAVTASYFASRDLGPFAGYPNPFVRIGAAQLYLATLVVINFILTVVILEMRTAVAQLRTSDERYRNFVAQSSEAIWRIELTDPMDPNLGVDGQIAWLNAHAYVAESNLTYLRLSRQLGLSETDAHLWRADVPWSAAFLKQLGEASHAGYSMDGLRFTVGVNSKQLTYITGFRGVLEQGKLVRVWGAAREVTELVELNERLREKQERLLLFARELVGAEERARRATAVDLHDGIGQQLVGLGMTLDALMSRSSPEMRLLLAEATHTVREVQAIAQRVIADLSPPGLYELGLHPALKWLALYMRGKDDLQVALHVDCDEAAVSLDLRVLVFKVIRELLRNVVKHSGVRSAGVTITCVSGELSILVEDDGVGFDWQLNLFEPSSHGFGLWSVADRVREARGEMNVDTAPGRGCRVTVLFPLGHADKLQQTSVAQEQISDRAKGQIGTR